MQLFVAATVLFLSAFPAWSETLTVVTFNVESGDDTYAERVAEDIASLAEHVDLWGLTEVADKAEARAYKDAAIDPGSIGLLEAHGTGTAAGDLAEVTALKDFFCEKKSFKCCR